MIPYIGMLLCMIRFLMLCGDCAHVRLIVNADSTKKLSMRAPAKMFSHERGLASGMELESSTIINAKHAVNMCVCCKLAHAPFMGNGLLTRAARQFNPGFPGVAVALQTLPFSVRKRGPNQLVVLRGLGPGTCNLPACHLFSWTLRRRKLYLT